MNFSASDFKLLRPLLSPRFIGRMRLAFLLALLAALMFTLAQWVWLLLPAPKTAEPAAQRTAQTFSATSAQSPLASIATARLWGALPAVAPVSSVAQDTRLPLNLRGILSGEGLALIESSGGGTKVYRIGDALPGGAKLKDVLADHVLIERAGVIERLALPRQTLDGGALRAPQAPGAIPASRPESLGKMLQQSPADLAKEFRLTPVTEAGKLRGYRLRALRNPELLQRAGMEADDILLSVNGTSLTQANDLPKFIKDLRSATSIDAVVLRNGSEIPLHLDLDATP
ncbi:MAG: type II secretion system protein N [Pseudomonadota bacterium]